MSIRIPALWGSQLAVLLKELRGLLSWRVYKRILAWLSLSLKPSSAAPPAVLPLYSQTLLS